MRYAGRGTTLPIGVNLSQQSHGIRGYTNEVRLRGLTENQGFETHGGGFCLWRGYCSSGRRGVLWSRNGCHLE